MNEKLAILILEDSIEDATLIKRFLERSGLVFDSKVATDRNEFIEAIENNTFDIILSDHKLPQFSSVEALKIIRERAADLPFILVTGTVSEEFAVSIMQDGANDYILKNNLQRLPSAITNAIEKHKTRQAKEAAEEELRKSEARYRTLIEQASDGIFIFDNDTNIIVVNGSACKMTGYKQDEMLKMQASDLFLEEDAPKESLYFSEWRQGKSTLSEQRFKRKDGSTLFVEISGKMLPDGRIQCFARDISKRKQAEEALTESKDQLRRLTAHLQSIREEERTTIAREVHDELGQQLTVLKMDLAWMNKKTVDIAMKERIAEMASLIDQTVKAVRRISSQLRPGILDDLGLVAALDWQSHEFEKRTGIGSNFISSINDEKFEKSLASGIFRVFQETLTNVARHSGADNVQSSFTLSNGNLVLSIADNGKGFDEDANKTKSTLGIMGMKERAIMMGGSLKIESMKEKGTQVILSVPLKMEVS